MSSDYEPPNENSLLNNILPSYGMFKSTISLELEPSNENFSVDPPTYDNHEMTPITSVSSSQIQSPQEESTPSNIFVDDYFDPNQESDNLWQNTILTNVDKLPNLTSESNSKSNALQVNIKFTENVCQKGIKPVIIDPSLKEFTQGDYIHGYITMENTSDEPISFDMVYVVFEGTLTVLESNLTSLVKFKFLNMMDLFASWSYANIDRLVTDNGYPHDWCDGEIDPYDNTLLSIDVKRIFEPHVTYKRYFTFKIPEKLLDDECDHSLPMHTQIIPTFGIDRQNIPPSLLLANKSTQIKDLAFIDSNITYSVDARVIGRASKYNCQTEKDHFILAKQASCPIRVIPNHNELDYDANVDYHAFVQSVKEKIDFGNELLNNQPLLSPSLSHDTMKVKQLYNETKCDKKTSQYESVQPFKRKIFGTTKNLGIVSLSTDKRVYVIQYTPPSKFGTKNKDTEIIIPLELRYTGKEAPEIKSVEVELVSLTIQSKKHSIPIEFTSEMSFNDQEINSKPVAENFDSIIIHKFQKYLNDFNKLIKECGNETLKIETKQYRDVKALAALKTKYINLPISDLQYLTQSKEGFGSNVSIKTIPWVKDDDWSKKNFSIKMDLNNCGLKGIDHPVKGLSKITLVPNFQSCYISRMYYLKLNMKTNGALLVLHVPLEIVR
ncbi:uncharacterized protein KGF55_004185 [Candida pseudojiufengensis]|uniref:uncharacterized protein n=1 Tax=Candida pseudojiufengensis TaxID=497109 RepID=UPI0022247FA2|nr:uncharacterized protein KGF55_004185 [Candida pseudojiufengensis]KAI5961260.1 hypothetical protein KGF55_004185 [Candida pseudojiufengensis]